MTEDEHLANLIQFAHLEVTTGDVEPWADLIGWLYRNGRLSRDEAHWAVKLYNATDSLHSAFSVLSRWPSIDAWVDAADRRDVAEYECTQERRNLRGGRIIKHFHSYHETLAGMDTHAWLSQALVTGDPGRDFDAMTVLMRTVWGVGRQSAFEWAEFAGKVIGMPVDAENAQLWESEGPRRSLQRLYGNPNPTPRWLDERAHECKALIESAGITLSWVDFETIICDFNVGRDGRYYPGRHLAAVREEINGVPEPWRTHLDEAWWQIIPEPWCNIAPGIDRAKMPLYRDTGRLVTEP